ncbi:MAG: universal stress protein [Haloferacaceae archaeon]
MRVLVPMDRSERSARALEHAVDMAAERGGTVDVVHYTETAGDDPDVIRERVRETCADADVECGDVEVVTDVRIGHVRSSNRVGRNVVELVDGRGYDHVVMSHHGTGRVGRALLGSAAETVVRNAPVAVTVVP